MENVYDLAVNSHGNVTAMSFGFLEHCLSVSLCKNSEIKTEKVGSVIYRYDSRHSGTNMEKIEDYLARQRKALGAS